VLSAAVYAPGVIFYDMCAVIKKVYTTFSMYNLATCCKNILNKQVKLDLEYEQINAHHFGTPEQRRKLYEYNMYDTIAVYELFQKTNALNLLKEGCSIYNCDVRSLLERGVSYFTSLLMLKRMASEYLWCSNKVNDIARPYTIVDGYQELSDNAKNGEKYSGAHVLNPVIGLLLYYIVVLDVKSMYPNIIRLGNICPSTLLPYRKEYKRKWPVDETEDFQGSTGHFFSRKRKGILPSICEELLDERDKVRKAQKKLDKKSVEWAVLEARQLQLKIGANSAYGGTGTGYSLLSCFIAAICIPGFGKEILQTEVSFVYNMSKPGFGVEHQTQLLTELVPEAQQLLDNDPVVIYGDTDSIMVGFKKCTDIKVGVVLGALMFKIINSLLGMPSTILVQHESDVIAMLLQGKKKYFYLKLEDNDYKEVFKGMEMVRRDYFPYLTRILKDLYSYMRNPDLSDPDKRPMILLEILEKTKKYLKDLFEGKVSNEELLMTCNISQRIEDYKNNLFQVNVAKQLQKAGIEVEPGTRVEFYYYQHSYGSKSDNVIAAKLVDANTFKPYYERYFERMEAPLERYLMLMVGEKCTEHVLNTCQYYSGQQTIGSVALQPKLADPIYPNNYDIGFEKEENIEESFGLETISKIKPKKTTKRKAKDASLNNNKITDIFKVLKS
jgi:DNA polymerase elongation subunit (family B)